MDVAQKLGVRKKNFVDRTVKKGIFRVFVRKSAFECRITHNGGSAFLFRAKQPILSDTDSEARGDIISVEEELEGFIPMAGFTN